MAKKTYRNAATAGKEAAWSVHTDVLSGLTPEFKNEKEAGNFDEYVSEEIPEYLKDERRIQKKWDWIRRYCDAAREHAVEYYRERTSE